jgi:hypothetical protein
VEGGGERAVDQAGEGGDESSPLRRRQCGEHVVVRRLDELVGAGEQRAPLRLWLHPFLVGRGGVDALIYHDSLSATFELDDVTTLDSGIAVLTFTKAPS